MQFVQFSLTSVQLCFLISCWDVPQATPEKIYLQKGPLLWQKEGLKCCKQGAESKLLFS